MLHELLYTSVATRKMSRQDLIELLDQSREDNAKYEITGMLLFYKREFMQVLEGDKERIFRLLDNIRNDERNTSVRLAWDAPIQERNFANWSMGFQNLDDLDPGSLQGYTDFLEQGFSSETASENLSVAQDLLLNLRDQLLAAKR